ncbi:hypothetical protein [Pseudofulvibacter geojedonensis]|uniref:YD repeat-containing protein n=1 Tax=Pseudofulvibacter geojedonensis TaxID=1123758 RepID=A0ABW3I0V4_9FLAO
MKKYIVLILLFLFTYSFSQVDIDTFEVDYIRTKYFYNPKTKYKFIYETTTKYKSGLYKSDLYGNIVVRNYDLKEPYFDYKGKTFLSSNKNRTMYIYYGKKKVDSIKIKHRRWKHLDTLITYTKTRVKRKNRKRIYKNGLLIKDIRDPKNPISYTYNKQKKITKVTTENSNFLYTYDKDNKLIIKDRYRKTEEKLYIDRDKYIYKNDTLIRIDQYVIRNKIDSTDIHRSILFEYQQF